MSIKCLKSPRGFLVCLKNGNFCQQIALKTQNNFFSYLKMTERNNKTFCYYFFVNLSSVKIEMQIKLFLDPYYPLTTYLENSKGSFFFGYRKLCSKLYKNAHFFWHKCVLTHNLLSKHREHLRGLLSSFKKIVDQRSTWSRFFCYIKVEKPIKVLVDQ